MALRKVISRALDVGLVGVYTPVLFFAIPMCAMNPSGLIVTVIPSFFTFSLIGHDSNMHMGLKAVAISLPVMYFGSQILENQRREEEARRRLRK